MKGYIVDLIKKHEGTGKTIKNQYGDTIFLPYRCSANKLTIGYGHNIEANGITEDVAELILLNDILRAEKDLANIFSPEFLYNELNDIRYSVLVNMIFQLGYSGFSEFKKMIQAIKNKNWDDACAQMKDSCWHSQCKTRADELITLFKEDSNVK